MGFRMTEVKNHNGRPTIHVDGEAMSPFFYALTDRPTGNKTWEEIPAHSIKQFADIGVRLYEIDVSFEHIFTERGFDVSFAVKQLKGLKKICPDCCAVIRLHVNAPVWWINAHREECVKFADAKTVPNEPFPFYRSLIDDDLTNMERISFASEKWKDKSLELTRDFVSAMKNSAVADALIGIQIANGIYGEYHYWGFMRYCPDVSPVMARAFTKWLKERYGSVENLKKAYNDSIITFDDICPAGLERYVLDRGIFRDPARRRAISDYFEFQHELVARDVIDHAKAVKEASDGRLLAGAFYGYYLSAFGQAASGGHLCEETVLGSEYIDFLCAPQAYSKINRALGGPGLSRGLVESVRLNGKLWLDERDQPTHFGHVDASMTVLPKTESIGVNRAMVMQSFIRGAGMWFYDFGRHFCTGWWDDPDYIRDNRAMKELADKMLAREYENAADALLVFDTKVFMHTAPRADDDPITDTMANLFAVNAYRSGASVDMIYLSDIKKADLSRYKAVVFVNCFIMRGDTYDYVKNTVMNKCDNVVFFSYPAYIDDERFTPERTTALCGMDMKEKLVQLIPDLTWKGAFAVGGDYSINDLHLQKKNYKFGVAPMFEVTDKAAEPIAEYFDGSVAAASKRDGNCRAWYFALPPLSPERISALFEKCGCHIYRKAGNATLSGGGVIELTATDAEKGELALRNGKRVAYSLDRAETAFFDATTGEKLF